MNKVCVVILSVLVAMCLSKALWAEEHGGATTASQEHGGTTHAQEHGGQEHGGTTQAASPSNEDIRNAMQAYVVAESQKTGGNFEVLDPDTSATRKLSLIRVHERVGKTGNYYYSCADFKDADSGELLDLDLDVEDQNGVLQVVDVRIHKVAGKERYTYDANDNRIPLNEDGG